MGLAVEGNSQDTLYTAKGEKFIINLIEIGKTDVKYRMPDPKIKKIFSISKNEVVKIVFASGYVRKFSDEETLITYIPSHPVDPLSVEFGRHFIALNVLDAAVGPVTLIYEYIFESGEYGIDVQGSLGTNRGNANENHWDENKDYSLALGFNYYPSGQGKTNYFFGPSFEYGTLTYDYYSPYLNESSIEVTYTAFIFELGLLIQATSHVNWAITTGLGYASGDQYLDQLVARAGFLVGYKF